MAEPVPLKRLGFVASTANYAYSYTTTAEKLYKTVRAYTPAFVEPTISTVEDRVSALAAPVVAKAQDVSSKVLLLADDKVDYFMTSADQAVATGKKAVLDSFNGVREIHEKNTAVYRATRDSYFAYVTSISDWAKDKLNPVKGGQIALDTLNIAMAKAKEATDPDVAFQMATDAWTAFAAVPVVAKALETADPMTKTVLTSFYKLHDSLVNMPLYSRMVSTGASTLNWASSTTPYTLGKQYVYPYIQPVADPALAKISNSKVITSTLDYWKPSAMAA